MLNKKSNTKKNVVNKKVSYISLGKASVLTKGGGSGGYETRNQPFGGSY